MIAHVSNHDCEDETSDTRESVRRLVIGRVILVDTLAHLFDVGASSENRDEGHLVDDLRDVVDIASTWPIVEYVGSHDGRTGDLTEGLHPEILEEDEADSKEELAVHVPEVVEEDGLSGHLLLVQIHFLVELAVVLVRSACPRVLLREVALADTFVDGHVLFHSVDSTVAFAWRQPVRQLLAEHLPCILLVGALFLLLRRVLVIVCTAIVVHKGDIFDFTAFEHLLLAGAASHRLNLDCLGIVLLLALLLSVLVS